MGKFQNHSHGDRLLVSVGVCVGTQGRHTKKWNGNHEKLRIDLKLKLPTDTREEGEKRVEETNTEEAVRTRLSTGK